MNTLKLIALLLLFQGISFAEDLPTYKIGISAPLSGPLSEYGVAAKNGFLLARKQHPNVFKNIEFLFEDNQYQGNLRFRLLINSLILIRQI